MLALGSTITFGQKFSYGAIAVTGMTIKQDGKIFITDSLVTIASNNQSNEYNFIKKANSIIYFTDGVMTHFMTVTNQAGKAKGFSYGRVIVFTPDKRMANDVVIYYAKQQD